MSSSRCSEDASVNKQHSRSDSRRSERPTATTKTLFESRARQLIEQFAGTVGTLDDTSVIWAQSGP